MVCFSITVVQAFTIPYLIGFSENMNYSFLEFIEYSNLLFIIDIILSLNTACYREGNLVLNRHTIISIYIKTSFFFDV